MRLVPTFLSPTAQTGAWSERPSARFHSLQRGNMQASMNSSSRFSRLVLSACAGVALLLSVGCGADDPEITNTKVTPSTWSVSGISDTVTFTITTDVLHLGGAVNSVIASVEGKDLDFDLVKVEDITGGERWSISTNLTLWNGISEGVYPIRITATDDDGDVETETNAATVTVTD